jgi:hypothetical protein
MIRPSSPQVQAAKDSSHKIVVKFKKLPRQPKAIMISRRKMIFSIKNLKTKWQITTKQEATQESHFT